MLMFILLHSIFLFTLISFLAILIPKRFKDRKRAVFILFFVVFPTLYLGYVFILIAVLYLLRKQQIEAYQPSKIPSLEEVLTEEIEFSGRLVGESTLRLLKERSISINPSKLETLLSYILHLDSSEAIPVLKRLLSASEDVLRLYAFGALYKIEKKLNETLHSLKEKLNKGNTSPEEKAFIYYQIASIYHTFLHYHIADQEFRNHMLREALNYARKSMEIEATPEASLLLAKIYIEARDFDRATPFLEELVSERKLNPAKYLLQLAEIHYEMGNYKEVKRLFRDYPEMNLLLDVNANFVVRFWRGSNGQGG
ncbi:MAG: tetratricopeptide repeat protein [Caldimicrobium sp.]